MIIPGRTAHRLAARAAIREHEEGNVINNMAKTVTKDEALRLALEHGLASAQTRCGWLHTCVCMRCAVLA